MPDNSSTAMPAEPASQGPAGNKIATRATSIPPAESRPGGAPMPKTIQLKRSNTATINLADAPGDKGDTARISVIPLAARQAAAASTTPLREGIQPRPPAERKSETIRISLTDVMRQPKKPVDSKQTTMPIPEPTTVAAPMPPTIQLKRPPTSPVTVVLEPGLTSARAKEKPRPPEGAAPASAKADDRKKGTTRLILDATTSAAPATDIKHITSPITVIPQTIRLKRPGSPIVSAPTQAKSRTDLISEAPTVARAPDIAYQAKQPTSRVMVLEDIPPAPPADGKRTTSPITTVPTPLGAAQPPRTIHLKRPSIASVEEATEAESPAESQTVQKARKAETAKIELPPEGPSIPITQRKTIKIKRTERNAAPRTVTLKQPGAIVAAAPESAAPETAEEAKALLEEETPSAVVFACAAAAVALLTCLVYIMAAQAFGPTLILPVPASLL